MKKNSEYVGVDEKFIPENEKYVNDSILGSREESKKKVKKAIKIGLGVYIGWILFVLVIMVCIVSFGYKMFKDAQQQQQMVNSWGTTMNQMMDEMQSQQGSIIQESQNKVNEMKDSMSSMMDSFMSDSFLND